MPIVASLDNPAVAAVPFVPPAPDRLTDEEILRALRALPMSYQEVIVLCDVEELSYKEIASVLALPIGTVMSRLHRGRALLRHELVGYTRSVTYGLPRGS